MALSTPPCAFRSARSSPSRFTPRAATRPTTGDFQMALRTWRPLNSKVRGLPTLTESTRPSELAISPSFPPRGDPAARASHIRTARPRRSRSPGLDSKAMPPHARPEKERLAQPAPTRECRARDQVVGTERLHAGGALIGVVRGVARGLFTDPWGPGCYIAWIRSHEARPVCGHRAGRTATYTGSA